MSEPILKNGVFQQGGVVFALPSHVHIMDRLAELSDEDLVKLLTENDLPTHPQMPRKESEFALGAVLQRVWFFQTTGEVPARIAQSALTYSERYCGMVDKLGRGETIMATKEKKAKTVKMPKVKLVTTFAIDAEKARAYEDGKYVAKDKETGKFVDQSKAGYMVRVMLEKKSLTKPELIEQVKKTGYKFSSKKETLPAFSAINKLLKARIFTKSKEPLKA